MLSVKKNSPMKILHDLALSSVLALFCALQQAAEKPKRKYPNPILKTIFM